MLTRLKQSLPLGLRKDAKVWRAKVTRQLGSDRYTFAALNGLDLQVLPMLPAKGTFLEVGANDGYSQSNTYHLATVRGWRGILIEPVPSLYQRCRRLRKESDCVNAACVAPGQGVEVLIVDQDLTSRLSETGAAQEVRGAVPVPARTLSEIIDASPFEAIDFMSVDVEGAELELLKGLDLERHVPDWLLIETSSVTSVEDALRPRMNLVQKLSHHDYLFRKV